jgi:hypothetical protein
MRLLTMSFAAAAPCCTHHRSAPSHPMTPKCKQHTLRTLATAAAVVVATMPHCSCSRPLARPQAMLQSGDNKRSNFTPGHEACCWNRSLFAIRPVDDYVVLLAVL